MVAKNDRYATEPAYNGSGELGQVSGNVTERKVAVVSVNIPQIYGSDDYTSVELVINGRRYGTMSTYKAIQLGILPR